MADLTHLPNQFDPKKTTCRIIIETPKGFRNKFKYDPDTNLFMLGGLLPEGMMFPFDFGFIPSTLGEDGDPVDVMVLMDAPAHVGCLIEIRILGVIEAEQIEEGKTERNDRLLGVAIHSYDHQDLSSIDDVSETLLDHVEAFFISYNKQRGKKFKVISVGGPKKAVKLLKQGIRAFDERAQATARNGKAEAAFVEQIRDRLTRPEVVFRVHALADARRFSRRVNGSLP